MGKQHLYKANILWTGNEGTGTALYKGYQRSHSIQIENKATIFASSDPDFLGDPLMHNPEELLLASLSSCHMLWYLHLCSDNGIIVNAYADNATGIMEEDDNGGRFKEVILHPHVIVAAAWMIEKAILLHDEAHQKCFIASSVNFPVRHLGVCIAEEV